MSPKYLGINQVISAMDLRDAKYAVEIIKYAINTMRRDFAERGYGGSELTTRITSRRSEFTYSDEPDLHIQMTTKLKDINV